MIYSMSDQFLELKMILSPSNFSSSSRFFARESQGDATSTSSDTTSTDSDFTFPAPASTPANFSLFNPGAIQLVIQDLSTAEFSGQSRFLRVSRVCTWTLLIAGISILSTSLLLLGVFLVYPIIQLLVLLLCSLDMIILFPKPSGRDSIIYNFFSSWLHCAGSENWENEREGAFDDFFWGNLLFQIVVPIFVLARCLSDTLTWCGHLSRYFHPK